MNNISIILVDDEPAHNALVRRNLIKCGLANEIIPLSSGQQLLDFIFTEGKYKNQPLPQKILILLDINMPGITGIEVLKTLKTNAISCHIPVIIFTTSDDPAEINTCFRLGCNAYLVKPVEHHQFVEKIQELGRFLALTQIPYATT
ncbi:MAG: response regulator [Methyloprofundus sp.]|nr:response regulator [Methyloprofundus sp.]